MAAANDSVPISKKIEDSDLGVSKSRTRKGNQNQERSSALVDITNGSPIVGLAMGTPSSGISKSSRVKKTPGSGEALLRGQVKALLQKVEEEAELSKLSMERRPVLNLKNFVNSPMGPAPTPANTPQIPNFSGDVGLPSISASPVSEEELMIISEVESEISEGKKEEKTLESQKSLITRSLLVDFSEKSESDSSDSSECSSVITTVKCESNEKGKHIRFVYNGEEDHDDASVWSIQANASTQDEDDEEVIEEEEEEEEDEYYEDEEEEEEDGGSWVDELCAVKMKLKRWKWFCG